MKRRIGHYQREAWIMAAMLPAIVVIGMAAGTIVQHFLKWPHH